MMRNGVDPWGWTLPEGADIEVLAPGGNPWRRWATHS